MLNAFITAATEEVEQKNPLIPEVYDIVWSLIPFAIILFLFWRIVLPAMRKTLDARADLIEGGIKKAETAQAEATAALEEYNDLRAEALRTSNELKEQATVEAARVTANAKAQIEAERQGAIISLRSEVGTLAIDLASGVIGETLSDDKKASAVVDRFLAELEASEKVKAGK